MLLRDTFAFCAVCVSQGSSESGSSARATVIPLSVGAFAANAPVAHPEATNPAAIAAASAIDLSVIRPSLVTDILLMNSNDASLLVSGRRFPFRGVDVGPRNRIEHRPACNIVPEIGDDHVDRALRLGRHAGRAVWRDDDVWRVP